MLKNLVTIDLKSKNCNFCLIYVMKQSTKDIQFYVSDRNDDEIGQYKILRIRLGSRDLQPEILKKLKLPELKSNMGIVIEGQAPNWLYAYITRQCSAFNWVGIYYVNLKSAIIVKTNIPKVTIGQTILIDLSVDEILEGSTRHDLDQQRKNIQPSQEKKQLPPKILDGEIKLTVNNSLPFQVLVIDAIDIHPQSLNDLSLPEKLDLKREVVLNGSAPVWLYCYSVLRCQNALWVACHNMQNGAVVVTSNSSEKNVGDSFQLIQKIPCPTIIIGGLPNSGKSVLTYALEQTLNHQGYNNRVHTLRAHWDGHGDWYLSMPDRTKADYYSVSVGNPPQTPEEKKDFFKQQAELVNSIRSKTDLAIVDFGGAPNDSDLILVQSCTHYIIICKSPDGQEINQDAWKDKVDELHNFFGKKGKLKPLAVIHSVLEDTLELISTQPYLQIKAGKWSQGETQVVPNILLKQVSKLLEKNND